MCRRPGGGRKGKGEGEERKGGKGETVEKKVKGRRRKTSDKLEGKKTERGKKSERKEGEERREEEGIR